MRNVPLLSLSVASPVPATSTRAPATGWPVAASRKRPSMAPLVCAARGAARRRSSRQAGAVEARPRFTGMCSRREGATRRRGGCSQWRKRGWRWSARAYRLSPRPSFARTRRTNAPRSAGPARQIGDEREDRGQTPRRQDIRIQEARRQGARPRTLPQGAGHAARAVAQCALAVAGVARGDEAREGEAGGLRIHVAVVGDVGAVGAEDHVAAGEPPQHRGPRPRSGAAAQPGALLRGEGAHVGVHGAEAHLVVEPVRPRLDPLGVVPPHLVAPHHELARAEVVVERRREPLEDVRRFPSPVRREDVDADVGAVAEEDGVPVADGDTVLDEEGAEVALHGEADPAVEADDVDLEAPPRVHAVHLVGVAVDDDVELAGPLGERGATGVDDPLALRAGEQLQRPGGRAHRRGEVGRGSGRRPRWKKRRRTGSTACVTLSRQPARSQTRGRFSDSKRWRRSS